MKKNAVLPLAVVLFIPIVLHAGEIHDAARLNDLATIKKLVEENRKLIASRDDESRTALHLAARYGDPETVAYLVSMGADVNAKCYNRFTPLHLTSDPEIAKILIDSGADLKAKSASGTPLEDAVSDDNIAIVELLLEAGEKLDFELLVKLGRSKEVAAVLEEKPWMAKAPRRVLHTACWNGHLEISRLLLRNGADPNLDFGFSNVFGVYSPLSSAVTGGHFEIAKMLCDHGAEMNVAGGKMYDSLFHYAVANRDIHYVRLMLEHGADVYAMNHSPAMTPLHVAANIGDAGKSSLLLKFKADVNAETPDGATPLMFAATWGHEEVAKLLLENGARLDIHTACALGRQADAERLLKANPQIANERDKRLQRSPLFWAVQRGDTDLVKLLIDSGADVNARALRYGEAGNVVTGPEVWNRDEKKNTGETPLHLAAKGENTQIVQLLLEKGAEVNAQDEDGTTPLDKAVYAGRTLNVKLLLERNADVNGSERRGSPLSSSYDRPEIMKLLLSKNPSQKALDDALSSAASRNKEAADLLLEEGAEADIYAASTLGLCDRVRELLKSEPTLANTPQGHYPRARPLKLAAANGHLSTVALLIDNGAELHPKDSTPALTAAAASGHIEVVRLLLQRGAEVNRKDSMGITPLHSASRAGELGVVRFLLESGAHLGATDVYRDSAVHKAAQAGQTELVDFLIDAGISANATNNFAETPLHKAVLSGHTEAARLLLQKGADVNARNRRGQTALLYAERERDRQFFPEGPNLKPVAELLRQHGGEK